MKILISNDDGYQAPGISVLAEALSELAEIVVVAPDRNRSGASNSLTIDAPLRVRQVEDNWYYVNGTPTDCVHLALTGLLKEMPDMVVSGINNGANLGDDILYSGTVAAAIEGRYLGLPAIAFSLTENAEYYDTAAEVAKRLVAKIQCSGLIGHTILNVNIPDVTLNNIKGFEITRAGKRHAARSAIKRKDPRGHTIYWMGLPGTEQDAGEGTDFYAIRKHKVSITPVELDWTNHDLFDSLKQWVSTIE